ncbi:MULTISPECIES: serine hydrolase domain-containing protein [Streptomyces]|uniref:Alkaline D-peptidase n=1 Tax=Streptomyces tsukubensis (strain DSM 42081 / NBRC 108919 / NRRL 18488 / 9993) TaxID=1114943 RepID=I2N195_STRT9|nr:MULTISPECIES: serine hydrolase domain-containing protein [Streptomyces]AZK94962.1 alkaline D-peptidase [Streptomyces tsukubensis]EIF90792.1 peptidase [Streptomyces tsukubensis NRRL18488]MYS64801.1 serine hydrolase [Streptomyces sp. SID5473]QKM68965.1 alkaline D-peptidase [Streptomyces tsukubensis NRRL18488]TAI40820.1 class A beta-lactamase-related serine hydrolase [Streptomyces tsukubensis]
MPKTPGRSAHRSIIPRRPARPTGRNRDTARRHRLRTTTIALVTGALAATAFAAPARAQDGPADRGHHRATQQALDAVVAGGLPGITAAATDRHGLWQGASGIGDRRTKAPRGVNDRFRIASITKTFVATVLLQMEAEGKLSLDDTVEKWLPGAVRGNGNDGRKITVRQLLNHTSGIYDFLEDPAYIAKYMSVSGFLKHRYEYRSPWVAVVAAMRNAPTSPPGTRQQYSNTNYVLAGLILQKAGGRSYETEVRKRIIEPLKLRATTVPGNSSRMPEPSSRAYSKFSLDPAATKVYDVTFQNASQSWAEGDMISSAADLNRFYSALLGGKLLPPEQLKAMKTVIPDPDDPSTGYGLGLQSFNTSCGTVLWGHTGGWFGSLSVAVTTEDGRHQLAFNTNGDWRGNELGLPMDAEYCGTAPAAASGRAGTEAGTGVLGAERKSRTGF